jgi:hypothetical protein
LDQDPCWKSDGAISWISGGGDSLDFTESGDVDESEGSGKGKGTKSDVRHELCTKMGAGSIGNCEVTSQVGVPSSLLKADDLSVTLNSTAPSLSLDEPISPLIPRSLWANLMPFQRRGVAFALHPIRRGRVLIADEMGTGKSVQAIAVSLALSPKRILIICPASLRLTWAEELQKWAPTIFPPSSIHVIMESNDKWADEGVSRFVTIISYRMLMILGRHVTHGELFDLVIVDEAHNCLRTSTSSSDSQQGTLTHTLSLSFILRSLFHFFIISHI